MATRVSFFLFFPLVYLEMSLFRSIFYTISAFMESTWYVLSFRMVFIKKNQSAPRPSEHPPVMGGKMSKRLGGIKGCKYKATTWYLTGFPTGGNLGSTVQCRGEAHRYTVHLH